MFGFYKCWSNFCRKQSVYFSNENSIQVFNHRITSGGKEGEQREIKKEGEKNPVTNKRSKELWFNSW